MHTHDPRDYLSNVRDGLSHRERIVLQCLYDLQQARGGRNVPTGMLYGTVVEHVDMTIEEMQSIFGATGWVSVTIIRRKRHGGSSQASGADIWRQPRTCP